MDYSRRFRQLRSLFSVLCRPSLEPPVEPAVPLVLMSHQRTGTASASKVRYYELKDKDDDPRSSLDSNSPILPKSPGEFDGEEDVPPATLDTDGLETFYRPVDGYEGAHRYDPAYTWDPKDEKAVVRKVVLAFVVLQLRAKSLHPHRKVTIKPAWVEAAGTEL
jgi:hypothetical protein